MSKFIKVYSERKDIDLAPKSAEIPINVRTLSDDTRVVVYRNTKGNQLPGDAYDVDFGEAVRAGLLDDDRGTMECSLSLNDSERDNFFGVKAVEWIPELQTFAVSEPVPMLDYDNDNDNDDHMPRFRM